MLRLPLCAIIGALHTNGSARLPPPADVLRRLLANEGGKVRGVQWVVEKGEERSDRGDEMERRYARILEGRSPEFWQPPEAHLEEGSGV